MTYLLKNGKIYDGTGSDAFMGDILVRDDRIERIGEGLTCDGAQVIDLHGLSVSSGFMDAHSHNDWFAIRRDPSRFLSRSSGRASPRSSPATAAFPPQALRRTRRTSIRSAAVFSAIAVKKRVYTRRRARCSTP